jgi:CheY-like chemotaxis protein
VLARACEPFYTTKLDSGGSGLGLAMVRSLVRDHGGAVVLESEENAGTRVRCYLPSADTQIVDPATEEIRPTISRGSGQRIAFVDNEELLAEVGARRLRGLGYEAVAFTDAREALAAITAAGAVFDLVVSDFSMPGLNGLELAVAIREQRPGLPVVIMTGWMEGLDEKRMQRSGVVRVLAKPASGEDLAATLAAALAGNPQHG